MVRSNNSFIKKQKAEKKRKKRLEKNQRKIDKKDQETSGELQDMIAYVDEYGNLSDTPPEPKPEKKDRNKETKDNK